MCSSVGFEERIDSNCRLGGREAAVRVGAEPEPGKGVLPRSTGESNAVRGITGCGKGADTADVAADEDDAAADVCPSVAKALHRMP